MTATPGRTEGATGDLGDVLQGESQVTALRELRRGDAGLNY